MFSYQFKICYDFDLRHLTTKISYHLLESSRVFAAHSHEFNFHIFYKLILGAPKSILQNISIDESASYNVNTDSTLTEFSKLYTEKSL